MSEQKAIDVRPGDVWRDAIFGDVRTVVDFDGTYATVSMNGVVMAQRWHRSMFEGRGAVLIRRPEVSP